MSDFNQLIDLYKVAQNRFETAKTIEETDYAIYQMLSLEQVFTT